MIYGSLTLLFLCTIALAERVVLDWNLTYINVNPDGLHERRVISINGEWPPKPVELAVNDILVLNVQNNLNEATVLHAHGLRQKGYNLMDGAGMVTQCPINKNNSFTYEFPVTQAGTYWIHSHFKVQYMDGLRTALIVRDPNDPMEYDEEKIITLSDWYHEDAYINLEKYMSASNPEGVEPIPQSGLINDDANTTFSFKPNKTYRLRILNIGGIATFNVYIDGHEMEVIEQDGVLTKPSHVQGVYLAAGQRLSVLVRTKNTIDTNYRFHANMNPAMFDYVPDDLELKIQAPIYYDPSHQHFGEIEDPKAKGGYSDAIIPSYEKMETLSPDRQINLTITFEVNTDGLSHGSFNDVPYIAPWVPTLHTLLTVGDLANNSKVYGPQTNVYILGKDEIVELVINNLDDGPHPFHLHGHYFQVIGRGSGVFYKDAKIVPEPKYPTVRDTIVTTPNGYVVLRFKADNPGAWIFHCHLDWHLPAGLAVVFIDAVEEAKQQMSPLPQEYIDLCHDMGLPGTGNAAGKEGLDLDGAPDGVRPIKETFVLGCIIATLVGLSTLIWHVWVDPGTSEEEEAVESDQAPLLKGEAQ